MTTGSLISGSPHWAWPAALLFVLCAVVLAISYWRARRRGVAIWTAAGLKLFGFLALTAVLVEPLWTGTRAKPGANLFLILADNSQGMTIHDRSARLSRGEELRELLTADPSAWQVRLEQDFDVRRYLFDSRVRSLSSFEELAFDGRSSSMAAAIDTVARRFRSRPVAGILLFTDGNATDWAGANELTAETPPIYPVLCGRTGPARDLSITSLAVNQTSFEDAPVTLRADVLAEGFRREQVVAQVLDESGTKLAEESYTVNDDTESIAFRLQLAPAAPGVSFLKLRVASRKELDQFDDPSSTTEATLQNNQRLVAVDRGRGPYQVLYVSGRPNWEFKFLRRALAEDHQVRMVGMIRIANREPKFSFRPGASDSSNPLFRGFDEKRDDTERYDQPVLVRVDPMESELRDGFPRTREELYGYHAIVIDDLEASFFTHEQMSLVRRFVSERGGGVLMLGGQESFRQGKYDGTPIEELLPVYLDRVAPAEHARRFRLQLTREGWLEPWVRLRNDEVTERQRIGDMPHFYSLNRVSGIKPGASVLAHATADNGTMLPALVAQRFGAGRCAAMLIGDLWRWGLRQDPEDRDLDKSWRQTIRWLVADVPMRVELFAESSTAAPAEQIELNARVRNEVYEPHENASVTITVRTPANQSIRLVAEPSLRESGVYHTAFVPRDLGPYRAEVVVDDDQGRLLGKAEAGWAADPAADEFRAIHPNRDLLEQLASQTGGEVVDREHLEAFATGLPSRKAPITEQWSYPLWHRGSVFLFAVFCLAGEWGLRRWKGLA